MSYAFIDSSVKKESPQRFSTSDKLRATGKTLIFYNDGTEDIYISIDGGDWIKIKPGDYPLILKMKYSEVKVRTDSSTEQPFRLLMSKEVIV